MKNSVPSIKNYLEDNNLMAIGKPLILDIYTTDKHGPFGASIMEQLAIVLMCAQASVKCLSGIAQAGETTTMFDTDLKCLASAVQISILLPNAYRAANTTDVQTQVPVACVPMD